MKKTLGLSRQDYERIFKTLETIASGYPKTSEENKAIELAAKALMYVRTAELAQRWKIFLRDFGKKLSPKQIRRLKEMGVIKARRKRKTRTSVK